MQGIPPRELRVVALVTLLQFINIMDFMMVMPLGPDFALALGMDVSNIGIVAGAYTLMAAVVALFGAHYLDRFDRRPALTIAIAGLSVSTLAAAFAWDLYSLVAARMAAGMFGGPATSLAMSALIDVVPAARRGRAMAIVLTSFSAASVLGVPFGLELARWFSWQAPFVLVGSAGLVLTVLAYFTLPALREHLDGPPVTDTLLRFVARPIVRESMVIISLAMFGAFLLIPHLSTYFQFNMHYPRERIGLLYLVGGAVSFVVMQIAGRTIDRFGSVATAWVGCAILGLVLLGQFMLELAWPALLVFVMFMAGMAVRGVSAQALLSHVPEPARRASFMSLQSATQHFSSGSAAVVSAWMLYERPDTSLGNVPLLAGLCFICILLAPVMMGRVQKKLHAREKAEAAALSAA